ncbi:hypothetical protein [Halobacillus halophilus]|uniref:hypothetical protein n=1 Tax=Halobacillus halophilus TaxID=1570 RepID=UPI001CD1B334|nr:hypothetical protein [Halobacillus halophilus]MCA1010563.1 hypothetical protein [Halobacillus halophilus]
MSEETLSKIRGFLLNILFIIIAFVLSYIMAYEISYSPLGYEIIEKKEEAVLVQSHNLLGIKGEKINFHPSEDKQWHIDMLVERVYQLKQDYLLFFASIFAIPLLIIKEFNRGKHKRIVLFAVLMVMIFPIITLMSSLNDIESILTGTY